MTNNEIRKEIAEVAAERSELGYDPSATDVYNLDTALSLLRKHLSVIRHQIAASLRDHFEDPPDEHERRS